MRTIKNLALMIFILCLITSCNTNPNKLESKVYYAYYYLNTPYKTSIGVYIDNYSVTETQLTFKKDSVNIKNKAIYLSAGLPKSLQKNILEGCSNLTYKYSFENQNLLIEGTGIPLSKATITDDMIVLDDGSSLYSKNIQELEPESKKIDRLIKITQLSKEKIAKLLKNKIDCIP